MNIASPHIYIQYFFLVTIFQTFPTIVLFYISNCLNVFPSRFNIFFSFFVICWENFYIYFLTTNYKTNNQKIYSYNVHVSVTKKNSLTDKRICLIDWFESKFFQSIAQYLVVKRNSTRINIWRNITLFLTN